MKKAVIAISLGLGCYAPAQEKLVDESKILCPMVSEARKEGLFQLIEVIGPDGDVGVAMPGDLVKLRCSIVNHSDRSIMLSEEHLAPQSGNIETRMDNLEEFLKSIPEDHRELPSSAVKALGDGLLSSGSLELPRANTDWGFSRRWILVESGKNALCACGQRHMMYSKTIEFRLPEELWTSVTVSLNQYIPAILLGPEEHVTLKSKLEVVIKRKKEGEQDGAGQPATRPESDSEGSDKPQPESEGRSR